MCDRARLLDAEANKREIAALKDTVRAMERRLRALEAQANLGTVAPRAGVMQ